MEPGAGRGRGGGRRAMLTLERVTVLFGAVTALEEVSLEVGRGEVVCLLGPSGSGKSTLLRAVAGIDRPTGGRILIDAIEVAGEHTHVEPEHRQVGMVFQDYALFPHLTVAANVAFGLPKHGARGSGQTVGMLLERLGLGRLAASYPHRLSGGERQRVALARAMAPQPRILLMDEPFSSLDSRLRDDVRRHTLDFVRESGTTTIIVTHDPDEALRIADRIALLHEGRLVQIGPPEELYARPATLFAARFFSDITPLMGAASDGVLATRLGRFDARRVAAGGAAIACLRPQHLRLADRPTGIEGRVVSAEFRGDCSHVRVAIEGVEAPVTVCVHQRNPRGSLALQAGARVHVEVDTDGVPVVAAGDAVMAPARAVEDEKDHKESIDAKQRFA